MAPRAPRRRRRRRAQRLADNLTEAPKPGTPAVAAAGKRRAWLMPFLAGLVIGAALMAGAFLGLQAWRKHDGAAIVYLMQNKRAEGVVETASGLQYKILTPGKGNARPTDADVALIQYEGKLTDGTTFDKSQQPTPMPVAGVVPGFAEAMKLMPKGAKYRVWIKPSLGYGDRETGPIPAGSVLVFDIEMMDFLPEAVVRQMQMQQQMPGQAPAPAAK